MKRIVVSWALPTFVYKPLNRLDLRRVVLVKIINLSAKIRCFELPKSANQANEETAEMCNHKKSQRLD